MEKVNILGVKFSTLTMAETVKHVMCLLKEERASTIYTPNPEIVMSAYKNHRFQKILNDADVVIPDGIGIVIGSKIIHKPLKERVAGYDLMQRLFHEMKDTEYTVYFYGAKDGVAKEAADIMMKKYPGLKIVGTMSGYEKDTKKILEDIKEKQPDFLLVGLGAPAQETFISTYKEELPVRLFAGVGGSFDGFAGRVKRAPDIFIKLNLEWFYRLVKQPSRWKRMLQLPYFILRMIVEGRKYS